ncbi:MAG TPA: hypothetical protein VHL57_00965 [Flavobacteriales bacterium]|jgi:hypothetical protein|nr:hypothetical protein [Flavobacteriales bacterium]
MARAIAPLFLCCLAFGLAACSKHDADEPATPSPAPVAPDTVALIVGNYHGTIYTYHWDMSGSSSGTNEIDITVVADSTLHNGIAFYDQEHVQVRPDLWMTFSSGGMQNGHVVLGDSLFYSRTSAAPGFNNSMSIACKKIQ